jgi:hypothetical protein
MVRLRLRTLMAGITLFALLLGGRLQYIQRQIAFHRREAAAMEGSPPRRKRNSTKSPSR